MTTCSTFANSIKKRVEEGKDLDTIAGELCGDVKFDRQKIIRVIKDFLGEKYLIDNAETLGYDTAKAKLGALPKAPKLRKIETATDSEESINQKAPTLRKIKVDKDSEPLSERKQAMKEASEPENTIRKLVEEWGIEKIQNVIDELGYSRD